MGLSFTTARMPSSVFLAGTPRPQTSTQKSSPRPTFFGGPPPSAALGGPKMPSIRPLLCAFSPATALPNVSAVSGS